MPRAPKAGSAPTSSATSRTATIRDVVKKQEAVGLKAVTDGEFRRSWWHFDFLGGLQGVEVVEAEHGIQFQGVQTKAQTLKVSAKVGFDGHPDARPFPLPEGGGDGHAEDDDPLPLGAAFPRRPAGDRARTSIPTWIPSTPTRPRPTARRCTAFYDAGCRYLQLDDTVWAYLCSEKEKQAVRDRGEDPDALPGIYRDMINHAIKGRPADLTVTTHVCRGNFRSTWISEGGYEPVAEILLGQTDYDGYFLEYDTDRAGGFEPLRFLPQGRQARRARARHVEDRRPGGQGAPSSAASRRRRSSPPLDQFCLSPQCGFASTEEGNILTEEAQWKKLGLIVTIAREVWGEV